MTPGLLSAPNYLLSTVRGLKYYCHFMKEHPELRKHGSEMAAGCFYEDNDVCRQSSLQPSLPAFATRGSCINREQELLQLRCGQS